jgi:hypothetical protein
MDAHVVLTFVRSVAARRGGQTCSTLKAMVYYGNGMAVHTCDCARVVLMTAQAVAFSPALMKTAAACRMAHRLRGRIRRAPYSSSSRS